MISRAKVAVLAALAFSIVGACGDDSEPERLRRARISEGCAIHSDCSNDLKCVWQRCHVECETTKDCETALRCVTGNQPTNVCQLKDETECKYNSQCPEGMVCALDAKCRDQCISDRDCVSGQVCVSSVCAEPSELVNGALRVADTGPANGRPCRYNSECPDPLFCRSGFCGFECLATRDCGSGATCVDNRCSGGGGGESGAGSGGTTGGSSGATGSGGATGGSGGTEDGSAGSDGGVVGGGGAPDGGLPCVYSSECPVDQRCRAGRCGPECLADVDCSPGEACQSGACRFVVPPGAPPGYGNPCAFTSNCNPGLVCGTIGRCIYQCQTGADCAQGFCCSPQHTCVTGSACLDGGSPPDASVDASDGGNPDAPSCSNDLGCQDGVVCNGAETCVAGRCRPAAKGPCDDSNPCTSDQCTESTGACSYVQTGPQDVDRDGHYAVQCGNGADDCDDTNPDIHAGHLELCDQLDNNCDGAIDEGRWTLGTPIALPGSIGGTHMDIVRSGNDYVVAASASNHSLQVWRLSASLAVLEGPFAFTPTFSSALPDIEIGGPGIAIGGLSTGSAFWFGTALSSLTPRNLMLGSSGHSMGVAWNGSSYLAAWADTRDGQLRTYVSTLSSTGVPAGTSRAVVADTSRSLIRGGNDVRIAVGATTALVFWVTQQSTPRRAILTKDFGTTLIDPPDFPAPTSSNGTQELISDGTHAWLIWGTNSESVFYKLDLTTGALVEQRTVDTLSTQTVPRAALIPGGMLFILKDNLRVRFGFMPNDVSKPVTTTDFAPLDDDIRILATDAKNAIIAWHSATAVNVATVTCGP